MTHICVSKQTIIGSDNGVSPGRHQAIIWTNAGILLIGILGTNFREILILIRIFSLKKMDLKLSSAKWRPFCRGLNVLIISPFSWHRVFTRSDDKPSYRISHYCWQYRAAAPFTCGTFFKQCGARMILSHFTVARQLTCWAPLQYKDRISSYRNSRYKDKTVLSPSYLYNGNSHTGKTGPSVY